MRCEKFYLAALCSGLALFVAYSPLKASSWTKITDRDEIRQLIVDKVLDGKYWKFYFRSDGKMAYEQGGFVSVREWTVNADGQICMNIYSMPDKALGCETMFRADGSNAQYQLEGKTGKSTVQIMPRDQSLIDAVLKKAGVVQ